MSRKDIIARYIWLDQVGKAAAEGKRLMADQLNADARAEFEEQGTASTWRIAGMATVPQSVTNDAVIVVDEEKLAEWVAKRHPTEVMQTIRPAFRSQLLDKLILVTHGYCHTEDGEVVPGVAFKAGGEYIGVSVRPTPEAKELFGAVARATLLELAAKSQSALEAGPEVDGADQAS